MEKGKKSTGLGHNLMQARWLVHYVPFAIFLGILAIVYIANGHYADNTLRRTARAREELKQLQYAYKTLQAELMYRSRESELAKAVEHLGLKRLTTPPLVIKETVETVKEK